MFCSTQEKCPKEKNIKNLAYCEEYVCEKLAKFFTKYKPAKEILDEIRASAKKKIVDIAVITLTVLQLYDCL